MTKYAVYLHTTVSASTMYVEADDESGAIDTAVEEFPGYLCRQCARHFDITGDWDGEAEQVES